MLTALDIVIFLKTSDSHEAVAGRVFGALGSHAERGQNEETGTTLYRASGLGFEAVLYRNAGEDEDPEFEGYGYALNITSRFADAELNAFDLDEPLSEYFARLLAFDLQIETATEILIETTEEAEIFEIRAYRRNPQFRTDSGPMVPKVGVIESRQVVEPFDEEDWEEDEIEDEGL